MTCTYGYSHFRHFQNCCNRDGNTIFKYMNYVPIVVATDLEVHFSVLKKGVSQYFYYYIVYIVIKYTLLQVCVHCCECALGWVKCREQIPSMGHHTWPHTTSLLYSVCTSHWCLVMSFWLKVCIYSHTRGVKLGLGLGFMQTSQVLPH